MTVSLKVLRSIGFSAAAMLLFLAAAAGGLPVGAQKPTIRSSHPRGRTERLIDLMKERLALTPEQVDKVRRILEKDARDHRDLFQDYRSRGSGDRGAFRESLKTLDKRTEESLSAVLSKEQMEGYRKMRNEMRQRRRRRDYGASGGGAF
jgi:Spy/CpxP family protein refolding chaperone